MLVSDSEMRASEETAFAQGVKVEALMEIVGAAVAKIVNQFYPNPGQLIVFGGKGNNTGDALVAARLLVNRGWHVQFRCAFPENALNQLASLKLMEFSRSILAKDSPPCPSGAVVVLDGLLGTGANGPPCAEICVAINQIHHLREAGAWVLAVDIPTGLNSNSGLPSAPCVEADLTATVGFVKKGLVADTAINYVGRLALITLTELPTGKGDPAELITPCLLKHWLLPRKFSSHKGLYGRIGILAGSRHYPGAARLCVHAALRAGAGVVILFLREKSELYLPMVASLPPEAIVLPFQSSEEIFQQRLDALCIGPGIREEEEMEILEIVRKAQMPTVVDAGALNVVSRQPQVLRACRGLRLLTPHPGEFARLSPELAKLSRREAAEAFVSNYPAITLLLKGARAVIVEMDAPPLINSTGNPGMGSAGMGDVLTGVCGSLLAQGLTPRQSASAGAWLCGKAAEIAIFSRGQSPQSLLAGDIVQSLGQAFISLRQGTY
ncbi:MAG: NAD(P)H-hydrate dehydratase [Candidatus Xiphinematobacter sp.]|nr:MAG: NAD(P)H-hydrate dehydratase [Candidatus Xiphinematobacter sp.]QQY11235.1 MAG: NAD(P)H-hydrate dehydratase [Candidatus Xiphinematobacter sp.]